MGFKNTFKELRLGSGMSQRELAEELGLSAALIGYYETGKRHPSSSNLIKIADLFGVSVDYLLGMDSSDADDVGYYMDKEAAKIADLLHKQPEYKVLFDASRRVKPKDIARVAQMMDLMSGGDDDEQA